MAHDSVGTKLGEGVVGHDVTTRMVLRNLIELECPDGDYEFLFKTTLVTMMKHGKMDVKNRNFYSIFFHYPC